MELDTEESDLYTLVANDQNSHVSISKTALLKSPLIKKMLALSAVNESTSKTMACSFLDSKGISYVKKILEAQDNQQTTILKQLLTDESFETVDGVWQLLDCWQIPINCAGLMELAVLGGSESKDICDVVCTHDGKHFATVSHKGNFAWWNADGSLHRNIYENKQGFLMRIVLSPDEKSCYFSVRSLLMRWDKTLNTITQIEREIGRLIEIIEFSPDGSYLLVGNDYRFNSYDANFNQLGTFIRNLNTGICITADSKYIIFAGDENVNIAYKDGSLHAQGKKHRPNIRLIAFSKKDAYIVSIDDHHPCIIWDLEGHVLAEIPIEGLRLSNLAVCNDLIVMGCESGEVALWRFDKQNNKLNWISKIKNHTDEIKNLVFSPNGTLLATAGADGKVCLYDVVHWSGTPVATWDLAQIGRSKIRICFSPEGSYMLLASYLGKVCICDLTVLKKLFSINA